MFKNSHEAREQREKFMVEMENLHAKAENEKRNFSNDEERTWNKLKREVEKIDTELPILLERDEQRKNDATKYGTRVSGNISTPAGVWRDENGQEFREFRNGENICDRAPELSLGQIARAMVLGAKTEAERRALGESTQGAGGYTVPEEVAKFYIDNMRPKSRVMEAGASVVPLKSNSFTIAKVATDPVVQWRNENADVAETEPSFTAVELAPKSLAAYVRVSRELFADSLNIERILNDTLSAAMASELDRVALFGSGVAPEPRGLKNTVGIGAVSMGTNGGAITGYSVILDAMQQLYEDNANEPTAAIISPRTWRALAGGVDTTGQPLMKPDAIKGLSILQTSKIANNETQGTSNDASSIYIGDFTKLVYGIRQDIRIELLKEAGWEKLQYIFLVHARVDIGVYDPKAFVRIAGVTP